MAKIRDWRVFPGLNGEYVAVIKGTPEAMTEIEELCERLAAEEKEEDVTWDYESHNPEADEEFSW